MTEQTDKRSYKDTINAPKTAFAMKANLVQNEPASLKRWQQQKLYQKIRQARQGRPRYVFHDGPPYANGSIHLGHLLNKCLKDFVVRSRTMMDLDCPYVPGWDCHGLPIEHKVMQELGDKAKTMEPFQIRRKCKDYAEKYVKLQAQQMQRLLTVADYDNPYLTMKPEYEAGVLAVLADLVARGLVYRDLKPVHWSIDNRTALAEAELEYYDREDTSVYVLFELTDPRQLPGTLRVTDAGSQPVHLMIWTTTPWTLPANMAVAVHAQFNYGLYRFTQAGKTRYAILAQELAPKVLAAGGATDVQELGLCTGAELAANGARYRHSFVDRISPIVTADYVTLEDGTGLVHTATGHGKEDYDTGKRCGIPIYCPVKEDGTFDETAPQWLQAPGVNVWKANDLVVQELRRSGHLFHDHKFTHSYPHDWRGKTPVIFRATEQWFIGVDRQLTDGAPSQHTLRELALHVTADQVRFLPDWGRNRMRGMLDSRPDWCLSRQRSWGLPIPAFFPPEGVKGPSLLTRASILAVADKVRQHGSDYWFKASPAELLADYDVKQDSAAPQWAKDAPGDWKASLRKSPDILDVWFESGTSWNAVLRQRDLGYPADLYLEGSDQHRGWFQSSLLPALGATSQAPFKTVLTHGFMVDKDGRKMSKSLGNTVEVEDLLKELGADVCRWWVATLNTDNDIKVDREFFKLAGEAYRKVRNTIRFLLSNLYDFDPRKDSYAFTDADQTSLDAWAMGELTTLVKTVRQGYEDFAFATVSEAIYNFCNHTMSAVYLAATKDRLYCDKADSPRRRRTQTAMYAITDALVRLVAPILPHTADEAWAALHKTTSADIDSVHLATLPQVPSVTVDADWAKVVADRDRALKAIEEARSQRSIENPLDCGLRLAVGPKSAYIRKFDPRDLADLCSISRVELIDGSDDASGGPSVLEVLDLRCEPRCDRSWKRDGTVKLRSDGGTLSDRDAAALGLA